MASPVPAWVPRPGHPPPNYIPNFQRGDTLSDNMHSHPPGSPLTVPGSTVPRPAAYQSFSHPGPLSALTSGLPSALPSSSFPSASPVSRPGPPLTGFPTVAPPASGPPQATVSQNPASGRPSGSPFSQHLRFSTGPSPGVFTPLMRGPTAPSPSSAQGPLSNGPPTSTRETLLVGPPSVIGFRGFLGKSVRPFPGSLPLGAPVGHSSCMPPPPFSAASQGMPPASSPHGSQMGQMQLMQGASFPGTMPPTRNFGMSLASPSQSMSMGPPGMGHLPISGAAAPGSSKIDPDQIPRPNSAASVILYDTRQSGQATQPPPATTDYIVNDTGNCSPRYMRCTVNQIPCTGDLLSTSSMHLAMMVQPLALPHPSEEPIQLVDFGESGPVRCSRCKGYINPFMKFTDQGRRFICNLCGFTDETPCDYHCNLGPDGRRRDADERPELCQGTVEFVATKEYMVRDPMLAVFFFLVDVSKNAIQTGATAAACSAIKQAIADLPVSFKIAV